MEWEHVEGLGWMPRQAVAGPPEPVFDESAAQSSAFRDSGEDDWVSDEDLADMFVDGRLIRR